MLTSMKIKALCVSILALAFAVSAHAQNISTLYGSNYGALNGDTATAVSIFYPDVIILDGLGDTYFASDNVVYEMSSTGVLTLVAGDGIWGYMGDGAAATSAELGWVGGLALDSSGDLYISDEDNCVVRMVAGPNSMTNTPGDIYTVVGTGACAYGGDSGPATSAELDSPEGLALDGSGNLYIADTDNDVIREVSSGTITTVAGVPTSSGYSGDTGPATSALMDEPEGVVLDGNGNIYIADTDNNVIRMVAGATGGGYTAGDIYTVAGNYTTGAGYSGDNGAATSATLDGPETVAVDSYNNFYIADTDNNAIREVVVSTGIISTVAGTGVEGNTGNGGLATKAELDEPGGVTLDSSGDIFIADSDNFDLREVSAATGDISTIAGNGYFSYSGDGGPANLAQLDEPLGIALDSYGNVYIADSENDVIREINVITGNISTVAGDGIYGQTGNSGLATSAELAYPVAVAVDNSGDIFIAEFDGADVREVSGVTGLIYTYAGNGAGDCGYGGDGSIATVAKLCEPAGLVLDNSGDLYISDTENARVREVNAATNVITTVAGNGTANYFGDGGLATSAELFWPIGLALDTSGDLFIADTNNYVIREVSQNPTDIPDLGLITTVAGAYPIAPAVTIAPQPALSVDFSDFAPGVYVDYANNIYIADYDYDEVYEVTGSSFTAPVNGSIFIVAGNGIPGNSGDGGPATSAELDEPDDVLGDTFGNLLIADSYNDVIRAVTGLVVSAPESVLSANSLNFGTLLLGSNAASSTQIITVSNPGNGSVTISSDTVSGPNAADFVIASDTCAGATLTSASLPCSITVTFTATVAGPESASVTIVSNNPASPQVVPLSGAGITFSAAVAAPGGSTSASVAPGGLGIYQLQISVTGGSPTNDTLTLSLSCTGAPADASCETPTTVTVTAGTPAPINVFVQANLTSVAKADKGPLDRFRGGMSLALIPFGLIALGLVRKRRKQAGLFLLVLLAVVVSLSGCNNVVTPSTPAGNYTLMLNATSGSVTKSTSLSFTVQ